WWPNWSPHPQLHRVDSHTKGVHRSKCFAGSKLASLTGFAPVISCMRGRHVVWTTLQGQKWWERRVLPSLPLACQTSALLVSYAPNLIGAGERNRTVVSALARPHSAVEPHPQINGVPSRMRPCQGRDN